jgi:hypothetical protein
MSTTFPIDVTVARLVEFHGLADALCLQELGRRPGHTADDAVAEIIALLALQGQTGEQIQAWLHDQPEAIAYRTKPEPPDWTPARLRKIRGAIWPTRGPVAFGPRPGAPDNIIDTGCEAYSAADLSLSRSIITARQYTHVQMGPFIDGGYHGQYPPVDFRTNSDDVLALIESWWAAGFAVVAFIGPDGWTTEQMRELEPIFRQPRWQAAMKQIVPMGWEPSEDTPNAEFVARYQWAKRVFPNALQYIHLAADFDAPGNNDDFTPGQPKFIGHAESWRRVVPYLTGYLIQNGPYDCFPHDNPTLLKNFTDQFRADAHGSLRDRFVNGYDGWPTTCASGEPLDLINAENTSYEAYWKNLPEEASRQWGHAALEAGADGFFDGGIV